MAKYTIIFIYNLYDTQIALRRQKACFWDKQVTVKLLWFMMVFKICFYEECWKIILSIIVTVVILEHMVSSNRFACYFLGNFMLSIKFVHCSHLLKTFFGNMFMEIPFLFYILFHFQLVLHENLSAEFLFVGGITTLYFEAHYTKL